MQTYRLTESKTSVLPITESQAATLASVGTRLASSRTWWGSEDDDDTADQERTVIRVRPSANGNWEVRVAEAVGVIALSDLQILVEPKIPTSHLVHLLERSGRLPRLDPQPAEVLAGVSFWELVARWFVSAAEDVLRHDLLKDYRPHKAELSVVRGRVQRFATTVSLLKGRVSIHCAFDEFDADNPLNRLLLAAAQAVTISPVLTAETRARARRVTARLDDVSSLRPSDMRAQIDRRSSHYQDAIALARSILASQARSLEGGSESAWTFLFRTPEMVEDGILSVLQERLKTKVTKRALVLPGSSRKLNPDLVFDDVQAIGDVKYKIAETDWSTSDLYQLVAFATGFRRRRALLVSFQTSTATPLLSVQLGDVGVVHVPWLASPLTPPRIAEDDFIHAVEGWLATTPDPAGLSSDS